MITSADNRIDALIGRIKARETLSDFVFIPGFPPHKTPSPVTCYTVAVSHHELTCQRVFIGRRTGRRSVGGLYQVEVRLRVYAPERSSGSALLRACAMLCDAMEAEDSERMLSTLTMTGIGFDTAARAEYRDVIAVCDMLLCEEVSA